MPHVRPATVADLELLGQIASEGFEADPVMSWLFPDDSTRRTKLGTPHSTVARCTATMCTA